MASLNTTLARPDEVNIRLSRVMPKDQTSFTATVNKHDMQESFTKRGIRYDDIYLFTTNVIVGVETLLDGSSRCYTFLGRVTKTREVDHEVLCWFDNAGKHSSYIQEFMGSQETLRMTLLGSVSTTVRTLNALGRQIHPDFFESILDPAMFVRRGAEEIDLVAAWDSLSETSKSALESLNASQRNAIAKVYYRTTGIHLIHGPPGTGKTKTLVTMLQLLHVTQPRMAIAVMAPTNVAICSLVASMSDWFVETGYKLKRMVLIGSEYSLDLNARTTLLYLPHRIKRIQSLLLQLPDQLYQFGELMSSGKPLTVTNLIEHLSQMNESFKTAVSEFPDGLFDEAINPCTMIGKSIRATLKAAKTYQSDPSMKLEMRELMFRL